MQTRVALTGNDAVGIAVAQVHPDVVAAFPITPQTELMHKFAEFVADGKIPTELVLVESEHSAMSACIGASAAGARTATATSSQGFMLMLEVVHIASALRLPIVMPVVNRAISAPINIHCDHSDAMVGRDSGWIQLFSENTQEAYDNTIMAFRIAEHPEIRTPVMINFDGFIISHTTEVLYQLDGQDVQSFVGIYKPGVRLLDPDNPITVGPLDLQDYYFEHKLSQNQGMLAAPKVIREVSQEFGHRFGRYYDLFEAYKLNDAELAVIALGSAAGTIKVVVDELRDKGTKAGMLKPRVFRPFPAKEIAGALSGLKAVAVMDRHSTQGGYGGPLFNEIRSALYGAGTRMPVSGYLFGLGGRDLDLDQIRSIYTNLASLASGAPNDPELHVIGARL
jgi:pyruvate ferredoxin oxidoreductase alpha subunit